LRQLVAQHPFHYLERKYQVTISLGVAGTSGEDWLAPSELIVRPTKTCTKQAPGS